MPVIDRELTVAVFEAMPLPGKHALALQLTGAPMTGEQKSKFSDGSDMCAYCSEKDSKEHQLLHCSATEAMRNQHAAVCQQLEEFSAIHILQPAVFQPSEFEYIRTLQFALPEAEVLVPNDLMGMFTDGSCQQPHSQLTRWAAFAIVCPISAKEAIVADFQKPIEDILHLHFSVTGMALVPGTQTVPRAELFAVVQAHEAQLSHAIEAPVYTDSSYVLKCLRLIRSSSSVIVFHRKPNFDLLKRWHTLYWTHGRTTPTEKVKAHQQLQGENLHDTWLRIGNAVSDYVAKKTALELLPSYTDMLRQMHTDEQENKLLFKQQLLLRQDLALMRKQLDQQPDQVVQYNPQATLLAYQTSTVVDGQHFHFAEEDHWILDLSRWGTKFTHVLLQWLTTLSFAQNPPDTDCGITWLELLFNFWLQTQLTIPMRIQGFYRQLADVPAWSIEQFTVNDCIVSFSGAIRHVEFLLQRPVLPPKRGQHISSLYRLGAGCHKLGLTQRPQMPLQHESMLWISQFLKENLHSGKTNFETLPALSERSPSITTHFREPQGDTPEARELRYVEWQRCRRRVEVS